MPRKRGFNLLQRASLKFYFTVKTTEHIKKNIYGIIEESGLSKETRYFFVTRLLRNPLVGLVDHT